MRLLTAIVPTVIGIYPAACLARSCPRNIARADVRPATGTSCALVRRVHPSTLPPAEGQLPYAAATPASIPFQQEDHSRQNR